MIKTYGKVAVLAQVVLGVSLSVYAMLLGAPFTLAMAEDRWPGRFLALSMPREFSVGTQFCARARNHFLPQDRGEDE